MKLNNQGVSLVGVMAISATMATVAVVGLQMSQQNLKVAENAQVTSESKQMVSGVTTSADANSAISSSSDMQFEVATNTGGATPVVNNGPVIYDHNVDFPLDPNTQAWVIDDTYEPGTTRYPIIKTTETTTNTSGTTATAGTTTNTSGTVLYNKNLDTYNADAQIYTSWQDTIGDAAMPTRSFDTYDTSQPTLNTREPASAATY